LNINCANPDGNVNVSVSPGGQIVTLIDDGPAPDQAAGDGIYSGQWTPPETGTFTLAFPGGDSVTVNVASPVISVSPSSLNFGGTNVGGSSDKNFTVKNNGGGILTVSGGSSSLSSGQSQTVTVHFAPTSAGAFLEM
jgi:hypothetical protein